MAEYIEQEIALTHKADAKGIAVFGFGGFAIRAPAFKIQYPVKIGFVDGMDICVHKLAGCIKVADVAHKAASFLKCGFTLTMRRVPGS